MSTLKIVHMASMARCGETLMQRCLAANPHVVIAGQLTDHTQGEKRLAFFSQWEATEISSEHPILDGLDLEDKTTLVVKQGVWSHQWPFNGFCLVRNPISIYASLATYDSKTTRFFETVLLNSNKRRLAIKCKGNIERFYRWAERIDPQLASQFRNASIPEMFAFLYNTRMRQLKKTGLPIIYYESFVSEPELNLTNICRHLGIPASITTMVNSHTAYDGIQGHGKNALNAKISAGHNTKATKLNDSLRSKLKNLTRDGWQTIGYKDVNGSIEAPTMGELS